MIKQRLNIIATSVVFLLSILFTNTSFSETTISQEKTVLHFATINYPPWNYKENGQFKGIEYDMLTRICSDMGIILKIEIIPGRRLKNILDKGKADLSSFTVFNNEIQDDYYTLLDPNPTYRFLIAAISLKDKQISITNSKDVYNYRIGHLRMPVDLENSALPNHPNRMRFHNTEAMLKGLLTKRVDVIYATPAEVFIPAKVLGVENQLVIDFYYSYTPVHFIWSKKGILSRDPDFKIRFNNALIHLKEQGVIADIIKKYSKIEYFSDYGHNKE